MLIGVPRETRAGERRVALVPAGAAALAKEGHEVWVQRGAGAASGFTDEVYAEKGAKLADSAEDVWANADVIAQVQASTGDGDGVRRGQIVIGHASPLDGGEGIRRLGEAGATLLAMELVPRITRAQSMDALSSQANLAGYKAVLMAASRLGKIFPMLMTAAGTIQPAKVFVIGAGVAGLQAIATAKRMGSVVSAFDVRPAVKEQVQSLGAKFVELPLETSGAEDKGGYAKAQSEEQVRKQRELMKRVVAESDVVITTALIPGKPAPRLITREMVEGMQPGSVVVDLAAERGGNCEVTQPGRTIEHGGVTIIGEENIPSQVPYHASQMYSGNVVALLKHLYKKGRTELDLADEIVQAIVVTRGGQVVHPRVREVMGMGPIESPAAPVAANA